MKHTLKVSSLLLAVTPFCLLADCLSGAEVAQNSNVTLFGQSAFITKQTSVWRIDGQNPYTRNNSFQNTGIAISSGCAVIDNRLDVNVSVYGLSEYPVQPVGKFEEDDSRTRALIDRLSLVYSASDSIQLEAGKFSASPGLFFLRSPADLPTRYYAGFKPSRLNDPTLAPVYQASSWGGKLTMDTRDYSLSTQVLPKLAAIDKRYLSSGNWTASQQGNSEETYLLSYSDYRVGDHVPTLSLRLGPSRSVALSDSYHATAQFVVNVEAAYHRTQRWRHLSASDVAKVERYQFPDSLYETKNKEGMELAIGGQYTANDFSLFGLEYYFQSEGYSRSEQRQQRELIDFLTTRTGNAPLDQAFDSYQYLMASEISNTANQGKLQGKHYLSAYASLPLAGQSTLQPSLVFNLMDQGALLGLHYSVPLSQINQQLEAYAGAYSALGSRYSEFALFGDTVGLYLGFKYYL